MSNSGNTIFATLILLPFVVVAARHRPARGGIICAPRRVSRLHGVLEAGDLLCLCSPAAAARPRREADRDAGSRPCAVLRLSNLASIVDSP
ncbi:hypothetical protein CSUI_008225 [Cystoisospora suis]|uniref:Transmembrane protein n=1 Tax=Cystoisospora suis TaxID=483139 RepID=A0A2C6KN95_9APIC|nr:hypothetical protein CSUI_008225 [Cystoisospora suis]